MVRPEGKNNEKTLPVVLSDSLCSMSVEVFIDVVFTGIPGDSTGMGKVI